MKNKAWFNLLFMFVCTAFFTGILSGVYVYTRPIISANNRLTVIQARLNALDLSVPAFSGAADLEAFYNQQVSEETVQNLTVYVHRDESGTPRYYALPFSGPGLWGTIEGVAAFTPDMGRMIGLDFISQNETPGLGGRIEEDWFLEQFRDISLYEGENPIRYTGSTGEGQVDAITGATATSDAVVNMLNKMITEVKPKLGGDR